MTLLRTLFVLFFWVQFLPYCISSDISHTAEIIPSLRSNILQRFTSMDHVQAHILTHMEKLMDTTLSDYSTKKFNFIISLSESFDINILRNIFDKEHLEILNNNHWTIYSKPSSVKELLNTYSKEILNVIPFSPVMKINQHIYNILESCEEISARRVLLIQIGALSVDEMLAFKKWLDNLFNQLILADSLLYHTAATLQPNIRKWFKISVKCSESIHISEIFAEQSEVLWIEEQKPMHHQNYWGRGVMESGVYYNEPLLITKGLTGSGQIIGISDSGLDLYSNYFYDNVTFTKNDVVANTLHRKVVSYTNQHSSVNYGDLVDDGEGHGTHVCGTAVGKAWENYGDYKRFNGIASDAKVAFFDVGVTGAAGLAIPGDINVDLFSVMYGFGARIFTNSWGSVATEGYDAHSQQSDTFMFNNPEALIFFANGNNGDPQQTPSVPNPVSSVESPATFKNGLSVGAGLNDYQSWQAYTFGSANSDFGPSALAKFSSRGPTLDSQARLKPEIVTPGWWLTSAQSVASSSAYHTGVVGKAGTSMASPGAAAMAAIIRQYFLTGYYNAAGGTADPAKIFTPSGALLKAMLVSSTKPMTRIFATYDGGSSYSTSAMSATYPNNDQGYGRVQIDSVLNFGAATLNPLTLYVIGASTNAVPSLYKEFTAAAQSHTYLFQVHTSVPVRITLAYTDHPGATSSSTPVQNDLTFSVTSPSSSPVGPLVTTKNTLKVADIPTPIANVTYTVTVTATALPAGTQAYALVLTGQVHTLAATSDNSFLLQSTLSLQDIPFIPAIIGMSVISFVILVAILTILIANRCPSQAGYFKIIRW